MTQGEKNSQISPVQQLSPSLSGIYRLQSRFWSSSDLYMHAPSANSSGLSLAAWGRQHLHTQPHLLCTYVPILKLGQRGRPRPTTHLQPRPSTFERHPSIASAAELITQLAHKMEDQSKFAIHAACRNGNRESHLHTLEATTIPVMSAKETEPQQLTRYLTVASVQSLLNVSPSYPRPRVSALSEERQG